MRRPADRMRIAAWAGVLGLAAAAGGQVADEDWGGSGAKKPAGAPRAKAEAPPRPPRQVQLRGKQLTSYLGDTYYRARVAFGKKQWDVCVVLCDDILAYRSDDIRAANLKSKAERAKREHQMKIEEAESLNLDSEALHQVTRDATIPAKRPRLPRPKLPLRNELMHSIQYEKIEELLNQRIGMNLVDADLDFVLTKLFQVSGVNIVADQSLIADKTITLHVDNMPLREILRFIERNYADISFTVSEDAVWLTTPENPMLVSRVYPLTYGLLTHRELQMAGGGNRGGGGRGGNRGGNRGGIGGSRGGNIGGNVGGRAGNIGNLLQRAAGGGGAGGGQGQQNEDAFVDELLFWMEDVPELLPEGSTYLLDRKTNSLFVLTTPEAHRRLNGILDVIDRVPIQIRIQARFIELTTTDTLNLGFNIPSIGNRLLDPTDPTLGFRGRDSGFMGTATGTSLGVTAGDGLNLLFQGVNTDPQFQAVLIALQKDVNIKILSAPEILTLNNQKAVISVSTSFDVVDQFNAINTTTTSQGGVTTAPTSFVPQGFTTLDVGFFLEVVASVGRDMKTITLDLHPQIDEIDSSGDKAFERFQQFDLGGVGGTSTSQQVPRPVIASRELSTKVVIEDGTTIVLGGLMRHRKVKAIKKVPILGDIPLLGFFFRSKEDKIETSNLIIIVRAQIVTPSGQTYYDPPEEDLWEENGVGEVRVGEAPVRDAGPRGFRRATTVQRATPEAIRAQREELGLEPKWIVHEPLAEGAGGRTRTQSFSSPRR